MSDSEIKITTSQLDAGLRAWWNAIPGHTDFDTYLLSHPQREDIRVTMRACLSAAIHAALVTPPCDQEDHG
jgi:hypothetical protein